MNSTRPTDDVPPRIWRAGDRCRVRCPDGSDRHGIVLLASDNGRSLFVEAEDAMRPLLLLYVDVAFRDILTGVEIELSDRDAFALEPVKQ